MTSPADLLSVLEEHAPTVHRALSDLGRRAVYPPDIPVQAAEAKATRYNATIGQITDGRGMVAALPSVAATLAALAPADRSRALLYSPIEGLPELRERWHHWQRPAGAPPSSLPVVTAGLTHALSLVADLFAGPGRRVLVPAPFWGNYRQIFGLRTGAEVVAVPAYRDRQWQPLAIAEKLKELPAEEPVLVVLNLPSNPGGYTPNAEERAALVRSLFDAARRQPLVVLCDDAYSGLVYEPEIPVESVFWELAGRDPRLVPLRVSGSTKEFVMFGARVGFVTLPFAPDHPATAALENKLKCLIRAGVGSPVALSQVVLLESLRRDGVREEVAASVAQLRERYRALHAALRAVEAETDAVRALPFNSGAFALVELPAGLDPERVRRHLLLTEDTGVISVQPNYLRLAFCSVATADIPELVRHVVRGVESLRAAVPA